MRLQDGNGNTRILAIAKAWERECSFTVGKRDRESVGERERASKRENGGEAGNK